MTIATSDQSKEAVVGMGNGPHETGGLKVYKEGGVVINKTRLKLSGWVILLVGFFASLFHLSRARAKETNTATGNPNPGIREEVDRTTIQVPSLCLPSDITDTILVQHQDLALAVEELKQMVMGLRKQVDRLQNPNRPQ